MAESKDLVHRVPKKKKVVVEVPEGGEVEITVKPKGKGKKEESGGRRQLLG